jgi:hypothetical protein
MAKKKILGGAYKPGDEWRIDPRVMPFVPEGFVESQLGDCTGPWALNHVFQWSTITLYMINQAMNRVELCAYSAYGMTYDLLEKAYKETENPLYKAFLDALEANKPVPVIRTYTTEKPKTTTPNNPITKGN